MKDGTHTRKGKVVYHRKKHVMGLKDVVRMLEKMSNTLTKEELELNPYICNALFEIVRTAFYPTWQRASAIRPPTQQESIFWKQVEPKLREAWKDSTFEVCVSVGEATGIPHNVINFVMNYLAEPIWDLIWSLTDGFFK